MILIRAEICQALMRGPEQKPLASICTDPKTLSEHSIHKDLCLAIQFKNLPCRLFPCSQSSESDDITSGSLIKFFSHDRGLNDDGQQ